MTGGDKLAEKPGKRERDYLRDYCTAAFRFYARWGGRKYFIDSIIMDMQKQKGGGISSPTEFALVHKEAALRDKAAELADLDAVDKVLQICGRDIKRAVEIVYLDRPNEELEWGDIKNRVHVAELTLPASERQIYYWLKKARMLFAEERGLRLKSLQ